MNELEFIKSIEKYYGLEYDNEMERKLVISFLKNIDNLKMLFGRVIKKHSKKYKSLPDIAIFNQCIMTDESLEIEALHHYEEINKILNSSAEIVFEDIRLQACINGLGGWVEFCFRDPEYENLHRKRFIELYKIYSREKPLESHKKLRCNYDKPSRTIYYGNEENCKKLLTYTSENKQIEDVCNNVFKRIEEI